MRARETLAIVLVIEALRQEWRASMTVKEDKKLALAAADGLATDALSVVREAVEAER